MSAPPTAFVTLTLPQLWLLNDFVRADCQQIDSWKYPPANAALNEDIALAIHDCEADGLTEYTLELTHGDLILIDSVIRRDHKHPDGAKGIDILRKTFAARSELAYGIQPNGDFIDLSWNEVSHASTEPDNHADGDADTKP